MFWENLNNICRINGTSPTAVVSALGIAAGSVTAWKKGAVPRNNTLQKLADYFGITVGQLMGEPIKEKAPPPIVDDEAERLNRVLIYLEQNGFVAPGGTPEGRDRADYEKVSEAERVLLDLFRQFPEDSQQLYIEALRASLKK